MKKSNIKKYIIYYNDGVYYGTVTFYNLTQKQCEKHLQKEIKDNNKRHETRKYYQINWKNIKRDYSNNNLHW
jgi:sporulation protein YlmC with PRC-barrel domain